MQLHVKGKNLEVSDSIRSYAERKLAKLEKQLHATTRVEVELAVERNPSVAENQIAEATVWLKGHTLRAREATRDMKASIDELTEKLLRQVHDERDKKREQAQDRQARARRRRRRAARALADGLLPARAVARAARPRGRPDRAPAAGRAAPALAGARRHRASTGRARPTRS